MIKTYKTIHIHIFAITASLVYFARDIVPFSIKSSTFQMEVEVIVNNYPTPFSFILDTDACTVFSNSNNERHIKLLNLL